jgi:hypothetical protein
MISPLLTATIVAGIVIVAALVGTALLSRDQRKLTKSRGPQTREEFIAQFAEAGVPDDVLKGAHVYLSGRVRTKHFPIRPDDRLDQIFGLDQEELAYDVRELMTACRRVWIGAQTEIPGLFDRLSCSTVKDFVVFLGSLPSSTAGEGSGQTLRRKEGGTS